MRIHSLRFPRTLLVFLMAALGPGLSPGAPAGPDPGFQPVLVVEATYPGASAQIIADTVAAPIEQQVNGVEHLARLVSRCTDDGRYSLLLGFDRTVDLDLTQVLVQNRVSLAMPTLPEVVQKLGVAVRKRSPGAWLMVALTSPDGTRDTLYLGKYATRQIRDELARVPGVAGISLFGCADISLRAYLDRDKMAALNVTVDGVLKALRQANVQAKAPPAERGADRAREPLELRLETGDRATDTDGLGDVVLKGAPETGQVRLRDVARVEWARGLERTEVSADGRPAVALAIAVLPGAKTRAVSAAVRERMESLKQSFPSGVDYAVPLDLAPATTASRAGAPLCLLVEPAWTPTHSAEQTAESRKRSAEVLRKTKGVQHVLSLPENPFARFPVGPCLVAVFAEEANEPDPEAARQAVRAALARGVPAVEARLRDLAGPAGMRPAGYPVDLAVRGPEPQEVRSFGEALAARLRRSGKLRDVLGGPSLARRHVAEIDRAKATQLGVAVADITETLQVAGDSPDALRLRVRNNEGRMVPLGTMVATRQVDVPASVDRVDLQPAATVSGNPAPGVSLAEARWLCETLAEQVRKEKGLSAAYGLVWLQPVPAPKPMAVEPLPTPEAVPEVKFKHPVSRDVTDYQEFTGRLDASQTVELRARVTGYLLRAPAEEGRLVKMGELLFEIDPRPYQARLDQARADMDIAKARVKLVAAALGRLQAARAGDLELDEARARVEEARAGLSAAEAALTLRKLDLDFCRVTAPMSGVVGRNLCTPGNLVLQDQTVLTTVVNTEPMHVLFDVDERTYLTLRRATQDGKQKGRELADALVTVGVANEDGFPHEGRLTFLDNRVNPDTGTLTMRAVVPNGNDLLRPGMFARVRLTVGAPYQALLVPEEAVCGDADQHIVRVVGEGDKVTRRTVTLGAKHGGLRVITNGLRPDDQVIVEALMPLRPGQTVKPVAAQP